MYIIVINGKEDDFLVENYSLDNDKIFISFDEYARPVINDDNSYNYEGCIKYYEMIKCKMRRKINIAYVKEIIKL